MPKISKQAQHLKKAREIEAQKLVAKRNDIRRKIDKILNDMDEPKLENTLELLTKLNNNNSEIISLDKEDRQRMDLISSIQQLSDKEILAADHFIMTMRYPKGPNEGKLISPYLQNKAHEYVSQSLYKHQASVTTLQETNNKMAIKIRQLQRQNGHLIRRTQSLGAYAGHLQNQKSKHISEIRSLEVSQLHIATQISQIAHASAFGIMVDESTRGEIKNLVICYQAWNEQKQAPVVITTNLLNISKCNSETVSNSVIESIKKEGLNIMKCTLWTTDNTAYMSSNKNGAIALFNKKTGANSFRIGCGLHIMQIVFNHFEQEAFGILNNAGFSRKPHPYNLLYLAWNLHNGYNSSDKDKPLNINAEITRSLYDKLMGFHYNQYQLPLRSRWGYELRTAKQYLDRYESHVCFARWFISQLNNYNKTPKAYLKDWLQLPPGRRAHEMPEKIYEWKGFLGDLKDNFEMFFADELLEAIDTLSSDEFEKLFDGLENGINKTYEYFEKWMNSWLHLPLVICRLGGDLAQSFANSFRYVILKKTWIKPPTELEMKFARELENDIDCGNNDSYGLQEILLNNKEFNDEFEEFCVADNPLLYNFPYLYNFVKTHIYFIIIHQQQVEGLFNKLDLKTHANMTLSLKQSKLQLASSKIEKENLTEGLEKIRAQRKEQKNIPLQDIQPPQFGAEIASNFFNNLLNM
ncbi:hypothetical protein RclHR1_06040011 [Rhizophagus clarus]|uniref:Uncharacterized protein n=1 Tax=Rhizophagus clarus TaxID=94130 RepID=A0A2Z6S784_9GLOM|nr:hypothetical protein RclHR1_06040011 [Rhizophagus clarus]